MKAPLRTTMASLWMACIAGTVVVAGLAAGLFDAQLFVAAAIIGVIAGGPLGVWNARRMRAAAPLIFPESAAMDPDLAHRAMSPLRARPYPPARDQKYC